MRKALLAGLAVAVLFSAGVARAYPRPGQGSGQGSGMGAGQGSGMGSGQGDDKTAPSYDLKGEALVDIDQLHKKFVDLATAMPPDKINWRPAEGVRSIGEVYLHISQANYGFMGLLGATGPIDFKTKDFEKSTTDKAKIIEYLNSSFDFAKAQITKMANADFAKAQKELGPDANEGDVIYLLLTHAHEHLGQSIAYAREVGVTPAWTIEAQAKAKEKEKAKTTPQD
jgi:uncharacterized damage-inducible protein DinB